MINGSLQLYVDCHIFCGKMDVYVVIYRGKDKNTTQGILAELVGRTRSGDLGFVPAEAERRVQSYRFGVSNPPSLGASVLCLSQSFARVMRKMPCLQKHLTNTATAVRH